MLNLLPPLNISVSDKCLEPQLCGEGGTCVTLDDGGYKCICAEDYYGKNCSFHKGKKFLYITALLLRQDASDMPNNGFSNVHVKT